MPINKRGIMKKQNIIVLTDPNKDQDDLICLIMLNTLQKEGVLCCKGVIATHGDNKTVLKRAKYISGISNYLDAGFPVCCGRGKTKTHYSDNKFFMNNEVKKILKFADKKSISKDSIKFLKNIFDEAEDKSLDLLIIADMTDIADFIKLYPELFLLKIRTVNIMGGLILEKGENYLEIDKTCANNAHDLVAAKYFHDFLKTHKIKASVINRVAATQTAVSPQFYKDFDKFDNLVLHHASQFWKNQFAELNFITLKGKSSKHRTLDWILKTFTNVPENEWDTYRKMPKNMKTAKVLTELVTKLNLYDPLTLIAAIDKYKSEFRVEKHGVFDFKYAKSKEEMHKIFDSLMRL